MDLGIRKATHVVLSGSYEQSPLRHQTLVRMDLSSFLVALVVDSESESAWMARPAADPGRNVRLVFN